VDRIVIDAGDKFKMGSPCAYTQSNRHMLSVGGQVIGALVSTGALPALSSGQTAPAALDTVTLVKLEYWHKDHLGSLITTSDHTGAVTARYAYDPFGKRRYTNGSYDAAGNLVVDWSPNLNAGTDKGYTGQEHLDDVGVVHMNGRLFDPLLGLFMQANPAIHNATNLQAYNRYSYCENNPLTCTDPSGLQAVLPVRSASATQAFIRESEMVTVGIYIGTASADLAFNGVPWPVKISPATCGSCDTPKSWLQYIEEHRAEIEAAGYNVESIKTNIMSVAGSSLESIWAQGQPSLDYLYGIDAQKRDMDQTWLDRQLARYPNLGNQFDRLALLAESAKGRAHNSKITLRNDDWALSIIDAMKLSDDGKILKISGEIQDATTKHRGGEVADAINKGWTKTFPDGTGISVDLTVASADSKRAPLFMLLDCAGGCRVDSLAETVQGGRYMWIKSAADFTAFNHEFGHLLGLPDLDPGTQSVMAAVNHSGTDWPSRMDFKNAQTIYDRALFDRRLHDKRFGF
jgi:RHS repeat-associated protein